MSGVEILGVVASIVQIAELGGRLSVKLCTFCHKFKNANKALRYLSKDVALTCNVLRQLGESLGQDDLACLYSPDAFETAQDVLRECEQVFQDLESAIEQHYPDPNSQSRIEKVARKLKFLMNESQLETVAANLERLKSTMLLMLNVVIYAGQIRSRRETHELQEQRNLLLVLTSEKVESEKSYARLTRTLQFTSLAETGGNPASAGVQNQPDEIKDEVYHYCEMVKSILHDINTAQQLLDQNRYHRVRNGFINLHKLEAGLLQRTHGQRAVSLFRAQLSEYLNLGNASFNPAQAMPLTRGDQNNSTSTYQSSARSSQLLQFDVSKMSLEQMLEHVQQISGELLKSQQLQQSPGQHDPLHHQQIQIQRSLLMQARAMLVNQCQIRKQQMQMNRQQMQTRAAMQASSVPQMQMRQQIPSQQMQMSPVTQPPLALQMPLNFENFKKLDQLSNQLHGVYKAAPNPYSPGRPDLPPEYSPRVSRMRSRARAPEYDMNSERQSSPLTPPFPMAHSIAQASESDYEQSSIDPPVPEASAFSLDFSALDKPDILEDFDFDSFLNEGEDQNARSSTEKLVSDQVGIEVTLSQDGKNEFQPCQPIPSDSGDSIPAEKRKRKMHAANGVKKSSEPHRSPDSTLEEGQSKRIHLEARNPTDKSSSSCPFPPPENAGLETLNPSSATMKTQPSVSKDTPLETLDAWILRWTTLERTELK